MSASAEGANVLAKLSRVFKEKAQADIDRIFKVPPAPFAGSAPRPRRVCRGCPVILWRRRRSAADRLSRAPLAASAPAQGTSKTREKLAVVDELLAYWKARHCEARLRRTKR